MSRRCTRSVDAVHPPSFLGASLVEGQWCDLAECLVWPVSVVDVLPSAKELADLDEGVCRGETVVELFLVGAVGALDVAVEFGRPRRQDKEADAAPLASVLKLGHELRTAIDLYRFHWKGHSLHDRIQEAGRGVSRGAAMCLQYLPASEDIAGCEVLEAKACEEHDVRCVHLDDGARSVRHILLWLSDTVRAMEGTAGHPGVSSRRFYQPAAFFQALQDAPDHRCRALPALVAKEDDKLVLAPAGSELSQLEDCVLELLSPGRLTHVLGSVTAVFKAARAGLLEAPQPAIESVARDAEVAAGQRRIPSVLAEPDHHAQPMLRLLGQFDGMNTTYSIGNVEPEYSHTCYNAGVRDLSERDQEIGGLTRWPT